MKEVVFNEHHSRAVVTDDTVFKRNILELIILNNGIPRILKDASAVIHMS